MLRFAGTLLAPILFIASISPTMCTGQSLGDAARQARNQKAQDGSAATKVIDSDDLAAPSSDPIIHLAPGATSTGEGTLVAPGMWKHTYVATNLDATRFADGGVLHITITLGSGLADASFDLYSQGVRLPTGGFPNSLASAHDVKSGSTAKIDYRFDHGAVFRLAAEGSWHAKAGDTNSYSFTVSVGHP
jgi:hypothetical protein